MRFGSEHFRGGPSAPCWPPTASWRLEINRPGATSDWAGTAVLQGLGAGAGGTRPVGLGHVQGRVGRPCRHVGPSNRTDVLTSACSRYDPWHTKNEDDEESLHAPIPYLSLRRSVLSFSLSHQTAKPPSKGPYRDRRVILLLGNDVIPSCGGGSQPTSKRTNKQRVYKWPTTSLSARGAWMKIRKKGRQTNGNPN
jgi:hypothetical protein